MSEVRTDPLTDEEIASFHEHGYLFPIRVLSDEQVDEARAALDDHLEGRRQSKAYELTDPIVDSSHGETKATVGSGTVVLEETEKVAEKKPHSVPFLFNLWERDERFWKIDSNPVIAGMARQLLGSKEVVLLEDGAVIKKPVVGGKLAWHQDYAYWPLASPAAVTCWIALDDVSAENGGMQVADGSHKLGEKLPVEFGDGSSFMQDERPGLGEVRPPEEVGLKAVGYELKAGECGFHNALAWHASGPNTSSNPRRGFIPRYVAGGTRWLGALRFPYNYTDEELECAPGEPIHGPHFPVVETAF
jgi:ectoine hydroxylase-related dioxygenase (phytanoyl-CoA dioxygenase family)